MKKNMAEIESDIKHYETKKSISNAMRELGKLGFRPSGHGCGMGCEHFGLYNGACSFSIEDQGRKVRAMITLDGPNSDDPITIFEGTIGKALKFIQSKFDPECIKRGKVAIEFILKKLEEYSK